MKGTSQASEYWLRKSIARSTLLPVYSSAVYKPLLHKFPVQGAEEIRLCCSGVHGEEKDLAMWLVGKVRVSSLQRKLSRRFFWRDDFQSAGHADTVICCFMFRTQLGMYTS